jgi:hypothetical protein
VLPLTLILLFGCGRTAGGGDEPDGGAPHDAHETSDARPRDDANTLLDASSEHDASPGDDTGTGHDGATGCDSGESSVQCLSAADSTHLNGPIAVDDKNVYWAAIGQGPDDSVIMRESRTGGLGVTLAKGYAGSLVSDGEFVYWSDFADSTRSIKRVPVAGGSVTTLTAASVPSCLAVDDTSVYWTDNLSGVVKVAKAGGTAVTLAPPAGGDGEFAIAVDATSVYWGGAGTSSVSKEGGAVTTLQAASVNNPTDNCRAIALVGETLLIVGGTSIVELVSLPIADPSNPLVLTSSDDPASVVATSTDAFWQGFGTAIEINEIPIDGGPITTLATPMAQRIEDLVVASDGTLYWTTDLQVQSLKP